MNCQNCGNILKNGSKFCGKCGAAVPQAPVGTYPTQQSVKPKEAFKKNTVMILIPVISVLVVIAIIIPTVIMPFINSKSKEKSVEPVVTTQEKTTEPDKFQNDGMLTATKEDFETLSRLLLVSRLGEDFNCQTTSLREVIEGIILSPVSTVVYDTYFDKSTYENHFPSSSYDTSYQWDPLKKYNSGYGKFKIENVKWICENIYHISFNENYSPVNSYCHNGYIYVGWHVDQEGDLPFKPSIRIKGYTQLDDGQYEVSFEQFDEKDTRVFGWYKVIADLQVIDGKRCWTFYSVEYVA